jgi:flagellar hook-associated protein 2
MGSPVTFSGFNKIDFGMILDAVMAQESQPLTDLETQQKTLQTRATTYRTLASRLSTFQSAVDALADPTAIGGRSTANTNETLLRASASASAAPGIYDVVVQELARAQVTAATSFPPDADQTVVAWGGALRIGGVNVTIDAPVTLQGLADRINATADSPVTASVIRASGTSWQLVLTGKATGAGGQFGIENTLTGGSGIAFGDFDGDGVSGNSVDDNAVNASDARALINNVTVTSDTNTIADAIPGVTLNLLKKDPATTATISIAEDLTATRTKIQKVVDAFNEIVKFAEDQQLSAARNDQASIARDPLLRGLRSALRERFGAEYAAGGNLKSLGSIGIEFDRTGRLTFDAAAFDEMAATHKSDLQKLFSSTGTDTGVFVELSTVVKAYTASDGLLRDMQKRITDQERSLSKRMADLETRLIHRRATLQKEYIAADMLMSRLNAEVSSLSQLGGQFRLF